MTEQDIIEKPTQIQCPHCQKIKRASGWQELPGVVDAILHGRYKVAPQACPQCEIGASNRLAPVKIK